MNISLMLYVADDYFVGDDSFAEKERLAGCEDLLEKINMYMQVS